MSDPEETKMNTEEDIIEENSEDSDAEWSYLEEGEIRELVIALPALRIGENLNIDEELRKQAVVAANLVVAAAQEAETRIVEPAVGDPGKKKKLRRPRKVRLENVVAEAGASGSIEEGEMVKKPRKKGSSLLTNPPPGPPTCNVCGKCFISWKAVFGHLRSHKDRGYLGFLPPPSFTAANEGIAEDVASTSTGGGVGLGIGGLGVDLNDVPMDKEEEGAATGSGSTLKFDLNRSPPHEEEEEREGDKAE